MGSREVSIVIPAFNAAKFLPATLQSALSQSHAPSEIIVVDDGSTDETSAIARSFGARVISLANGGPSAARNAGTRAASGEYIAYLDADDVWAPEKLELQLAALQSYGKPAFSFTDFRLFDEKGVHQMKSELLRLSAFRKTVGSAADRSEILIAAGGTTPVLHESYVLPSSVLARRTDILRVGGFDETLRVAEDYEFLLRLYTIVPAIVIMKPLLLYRKHADQATSNGTLMKTSMFDVALRVAASPDRYPPADVQYIAMTDYVRQFDLGFQQSRLGNFEDAVPSLERSVAARKTLRAGALLFIAKACRSSAGRFVFDTVRNTWKRRPMLRHRVRSSNNAPSTMGQSIAADSQMMSPFTESQVSA